MKKKTLYSDGPIGDVKVVRDFLPPPEDLVFKEDQVKVTIGLSQSSVDFFKQEAKKHHTQYQKMIRRLLDLYVAQHKELPLTNR
ncbi:MAG: CopG family transcriptional regulator [Spartobacteria bacterium]|nr:CopG family transcriptional regulator [Spartobacteria bacterium]